VPDYVKERNLVIMLPDSEGQYITLPLPYGLNVFHVIGGQMADVLTGERSVQSAAKISAMTLSSSFNPVGFEQSNSALGSAVKSLVPGEIFKPFIELTLNENFYGGAIYREQFPSGVPKPDSSIPKQNTNEAYVWLASLLNDISGGSAHIEGTLDFHPETFEHLVNFAGGGAGQFAGRTEKFISSLLTDQEITLNDIPIARRFFNQVDPMIDVYEFDDRYIRIMQYDKEHQAATEESRLRGARFKRDNLDILSLVDDAKATDRALGDLYDRMREVEDSGRDTASIEQQMQAEVAKFNKEYIRRLGNAAE
jgi:hypothetical protein